MYTGICSPVYQHGGLMRTSSPNLQTRYANTVMRQFTQAVSFDYAEPALRGEALRLLAA